MNKKNKITKPTTPKNILMEFALPKSSNSPIKVIGVGGGGSNAVNTMFEQGIKGVDFVVCNTVSQAVVVSSVALKVQLGSTLSAGLGSSPKTNIRVSIKPLKTNM